MYNLIRNTMLAAALFAVSVPAFAQDTAKPAQTPAQTPAAGAQPGRQGRRGGGRALTLTAIPVGVLDMLTPLKDDQKTKITGIQDKAKTDAAAAADATARRDVNTKAAADIKAVLTTDQVSAVDKALPMLSLLNNSRTIPVAALPDVKLTKEQMDKISALTETETAKLKGLTGADRQAKNQEVNDDFKTQVMAMLTTTQKDALTKYEAAHPQQGRRNNAKAA